MWRCFFKRFGAIVVCTEDFDGEIRYRFARRTPLGLRCNALTFGLKVLLNEDGTTSGSCYVVKWGRC